MLVININIIYSIIIPHFQEGKQYLNCPTCRAIHHLPEGAVQELPNAFYILSLLDLRSELDVKKTAKKTCPKHDTTTAFCETCFEIVCQDHSVGDHRKVLELARGYQTAGMQRIQKHLTNTRHGDVEVYCKTCHSVIHSSFAIKEHKQHDCELISECYHEHVKSVHVDLDLLKQKKEDINTAIMALVSREKEVIQQEEQIKKEVNAHAEQLVEKIQMSQKYLLQQVDEIVREKRNLLNQQRKKAEKVHAQLKSCEEIIEQSLSRLSQKQLIMEKQELVEQIKRVNDNVEPIQFLPIEKADMNFTMTEIDESEMEIGHITSNRYGDATLEVPSSPCTADTEAIAILTLQSHDGSQFLLPPSLITSKLFSSSGDGHNKNCFVNHLEQGKYSITFTPCTRGEHLLMVQVGGIDIPGSPIVFSVLPTVKMRGKAVKTITGLKCPYNATIGNNCEIVVVEHQAHCVTILNSEGKRVRSLGTCGTKEGQFTYPLGIAISKDNHVFTTDNHRLQKLTFDGVCVKAIGGREGGSGKLQFRYPKGIAIEPVKGHVFVADCGNNRIQVFSNDLTFSHTINPGIFKHFKSPYDVAVDTRGCLYVAERDNHCITKFTTTGQYLKRFGSEGFAPGQLDSPTSLTFQNDLVYVCEYGNNRVSIFDAEGTFLQCFGTKGNGKGEFDSPCGMTIDNLGNLYVSDTGNNRIIVL